MSAVRLLRAATLVGTFAFLIAPPGGTAIGTAQGQQPAARPVVSFASRSDTSRPIRDLPQRPPTPAVLGQIFERPFKLLPNRRDSVEADAFDPVVQESAPTLGVPAVAGSFDGVSNRNSVLPPDPTGAIGPNHYVQMVNLSFAVYDRSGTVLYGPVNNQTLWTGFGGPCAVQNDGDPIVLYDHLADRWMLSQFALPNFPSGPFYQCIAVSQTGNPLGAWHRYEFTVHQTKLNDYPKFGVWPDGYYMSINQFRCGFLRCSWAGQGVVAFERSAMLTGAAARMIAFDLENVDANLGGMLPADLDGPAPPSGTPNYFALVDDDAWGYSPDQLQIWAFQANWTTPPASTFTRAVNLNVASFNSNLCGYSRNCIPQQGTATRVDAISDRLMYRLQYRNFGTHQTLVTNHTVDVNGADRAGVRWYELRNSGAGWSVFQQGTHAPADAHHRWMASAAMNGAGDIAVGYSVSSTSLFPSVRVAGRVVSDPAGMLPQAEATLVTGNGYQTHSSGRWGDYSQLSVDPTDDCTFWYTQQYYGAASSANWRTRIGAVKLRECGGIGDTTPPNAAITAPAAGTTVSGTVAVTANATDDVGVSRVDFSLDGVFQASDSTAPYVWNWNTAGAANGSHTLGATAYDAAGNVGTSSPVTVTVSNVAAPITLSATSYVVKRQSKVDLVWSGAATSSVDVYRNDVRMTTTANDGAHTDTVRKASGAYTYKVCEAGSANCSNTATVTF